MSYTHLGKAQVILRNDPIDPDGTDYFYFAWGEWLRENEVITDASVIITGGVQADEIVYLASRTDEDGTVYTHVYGIPVSVTPGAMLVSITCRVSTNQGRLNIDRTINVPVRSL